MVLPWMAPRARGRRGGGDLKLGAGTSLQPRTLGRAAGVFVGTFLYALMALRGVGSLPGGATSDLTIWVAFAWLLASVWMLIELAGLLSNLMQTNVLFLLGDAGHREIVERLVALARDADAVLHVPFSIGDAITDRAALAFVHGGDGRVCESALRDAVLVERDRKLQTDPKYALRLLVDIAVRALATGYNQPTTTIQALDHIQALLVSLGHCHLETGVVRDATGAPRLVYEATTWEDYLELGLAEIQHCAAASVQVDRRLAELFAFLAENLSEARRPAVERMAGELLAGPRDRQGLGHRVEAVRH